MDGTLYDEAEFIVQAYRPIADIIAGASGGDAGWVYRFLVRRWIQKGSSYPRIFDEALTAGGVSPETAAAAIEACLAVFRGFDPVLTLPARTATILDAMRERYPLFLVSDGSPALQQRKVAALGLSRWFETADLGFCATLGAGFEKPDTRILREIQALRVAGAIAAEVVYFGDRSIDAQFAANAGFQYVQVHCMLEPVPAVRA